MNQLYSYTTGHFQLAIDDETNKSVAYLKSVDGGFVSSAPVEEPIGGDVYRVKHSSVASIEPFSVELGMVGAIPALKWIQASWNRNFARRNGYITHADFDMKETMLHEFTDALITETTFPALDGASKDAAYIKLKFMPEGVTVTPQTGRNVDVTDQNIPSRQKIWLCSGFRLNIDGVPHAHYANKIDSFTIKQGIKTMYLGAERFPQIEPTKIDFPNISGTISAGYGTGFQAWYDQCVASGENDERMVKTGSLEMLAPNKSTVLFRITLSDIGLVSYKLMPSTANSDQLKRARFELFVGKMAIDGPGELASSR